MRRSLLGLLALVVLVQGGLAQEPTGLFYQGIPVLQVTPGSGIHPPKATDAPQAEFTDKARRKKINGKCALRLVVGLDGKTHDVRVIRCTDAAFIQSSMRAVGQYRFIPATNPDGMPVPVLIQVIFNYQINGGQDYVEPVRISFDIPSATVAIAPDASGVVPLTKEMTPPLVKQSFNDSYGTYVFTVEGSAPCDVILTVDEKGKASNPESGQCENTGRYKAAVKTLLAAVYEPAKVDGKPVAVRAVVHLEYGDLRSK